MLKGLPTERNREIGPKILLRLTACEYTIKNVIQFLPRQYILMGFVILRRRGLCYIPVFQKYDGTYLIMTSEPSYPTGIFIKQTME